MSEFCLKWNNHIPNMLTVMQNLMTAETFTDVTLACDGHTIRAHRLVLSACSSFFHQMFLANPGPSPIVVLHGMRYTIVKGIVDFMYKGEVSVKNSEMAEMLHMARTLDVKGLTAVCKEQLSIEENEAAARAGIVKPIKPIRKKRRCTTENMNVSGEEGEEGDGQILEHEEVQDDDYEPLQDLDENSEDSEPTEPRKRAKSPKTYSKKHQKVTKLPPKSSYAARRLRGSTSAVWNWFLPVTRDSARCKLCQKCFKYSTSISNLKVHLKAKHGKDSQGTDYPADFRGCWPFVEPQDEKKGEKEKRKENEDMDVLTVAVRTLQETPEKEQEAENHTVSVLSLQQDEHGNHYITLPGDSTRHAVIVQEAEEK